MNKLWVGLSLAFLLVAWVSICAVALVVYRTTEVGFRQYVTQRNASEVNQDQLDRLQTYYAENGSWDGVESVLGGRGENSRRGATISVADIDGVILASTDDSLVGTTLSPEAASQTIELIAEQRTVGLFYRFTPGEQALGAAETAFLNEATRTLTITGIIISLLAVAGGVSLAWTLTRPLRRLTDTTLELSSGKLGHQVAVKGTEEIEALAQAFNTMSLRLAEGEALRQRMAADIAHELRTPISVLRGHLAAMRDGVFALDQEHLAVTYDQTLYLGRLVDDLRLLTQAEAGHLPLNFSAVSPSKLVGEIIENFRPLVLDAEIRLTFSDSASDSEIQGDAIRLRQVLDNLLTNALRHTPVDGEIAVEVRPVGTYVRFAVSNTGSTLKPEHVQQAFLPFWRASESRERDTGGGGLGLAISKQLVELHGGRIWVETSEDCVRFIFELPAT